MARRFYQKDDEVESEQSTPVSTSLAGIIKLQPNRKKAVGPWRSMQASELGEHDNTGRYAKHVPSTAESLLSSSTLVAYPMASPHVQSPMPTVLSPIPAHHGMLESQTNIPGDSTELPRAIGDEKGPNFKHTFTGDLYEQLFGKLPDPIRLHEEMGEFDGQVIFIGHPDRDISAHQWSSKSFQWVNIGRYAHSRGKVEGSLASDRLKGCGTSHDPLNFFKLAAENREKLIVENGRSKEVPAGVHRSVPADAARVKSLSTEPSLASESLSTFTHGSTTLALPLEGTKPTTPMIMHATVHGECLEDPFIAPIKPPASKTSDKIESKGSLDFEYEFPFRSVPSRQSVSECAVRSSSKEPVLEAGRGLHEESYDNTVAFDRLSQPALRDIDFGEEASSRVLIANRSGFLPQRISLPSSPEDLRDRRKLRKRLAELGDPVTRPGALSQGRVGTPNCAYLQPTARSLFPPPGLTIANPHRIVPELHVSVHTYADMARASSEASGSDATTVNAAAAALKFSDPDGLRQGQEYEIANGLGQQAPTMQYFKGPFFTDSKPSTSDPTVLLSVRISEEEKLLNWFRNGHRPSRQQEYAKTLMSAAAPNGRSRTLGVIGEAFDAQRGISYQNTPPFVRLYEGLSEYIEEYHSGSGRSYFTRAWKAAPPQLRDSGPEGNNSYFTRPTSFPPYSKATLGDSDWETASHAWGGSECLNVPARARVPSGCLPGGGICSTGST